MRLLPQLGGGYYYPYAERIEPREMLCIEGEKDGCLRLARAFCDQRIIGAAAGNSDLASAPEQRAIAVSVKSHDARTVEEVLFEQRECVPGREPVR